MARRAPRPKSGVQIPAKIPLKDKPSSVIGQHLDDLWPKLQQLARDHANLHGDVENIQAGEPETPSTVQAGVSSDAGDETNPALEDHVHAVETAAPSNPTGTAASEGTGTALMRADATIKQGIVTTKGDLLGRSTVPARVPVGTDGQVLTADSGEALGVKWDDTPSSGWVDDGTVVRLDDPTDQVGIGTATPMADDSLGVVGAVGIDKHDDDAVDAPALYFRRSRDTEASPDAVQGGDLLAIMEMLGCSNDGNYHASARIELEAQSTFATGKLTDYTSDLIFKMANPAVLQEAMRLKSNGVLQVAGTVETGSMSIGDLSVFNFFHLSPDAILSPEAGSASLSLGWFAEEVTIAASTTDTAIQLPAGALIVCVPTFVTETITRATTDITDFDVGDTTTAQRFSAGLARTSGTPDHGLRQWRGGVATDAAGPTQAAADSVRITCNGGSGGFTAGKVRVVIFYLLITPPVS